MNLASVLGAVCDSRINTTDIDEFREYMLDDTAASSAERQDCWVALKNCCTGEQSQLINLPAVVILAAKAIGTLEDHGLQWAAQQPGVTDEDRMIEMLQRALAGGDFKFGTDDTPHPRLVLPMCSESWLGILDHGNQANKDYTGLAHNHLLPDSSVSFKGMPWTRGLFELGGTIEGELTLLWGPLPEDVYRILHHSVSKLAPGILRDYTPRLGVTVTRQLNLKIAKVQCNTDDRGLDWSLPLAGGPAAGAWTNGRHIDRLHRTSTPNRAGTTPECGAPGGMPQVCTCMMVPTEVFDGTRNITLTPPGAIAAFGAPGQIGPDTHITKDDEAQRSARPHAAVLVGTGAVMKTLRDSAVEAGDNLQVHLNRRSVGLGWLHCFRRDVPEAQDNFDSTHGTGQACLAGLFAGQDEAPKPISFFQKLGLPRDRSGILRVVELARGNMGLEPAAAAAAPRRRRTGLRVTGGMDLCAEDKLRYCQKLVGRGLILGPTAMAAVMCGELVDGIAYGSDSDSDE
jgi:hypothetical protein